MLWNIQFFLPIQNAIRPFTVGRKNWLFSDSVEGAEASAIAYTMVEMAKAHNLNIYQYLSYVLEQRPNENWSDEQLAKLAPWSEKLQTLKMWEWICSKILQPKIGWGKFIGTAGLFGAYLKNVSYEKYERKLKLAHLRYLSQNCVYMYGVSLEA